MHASRGQASSPPSGASELVLSGSLVDDGGQPLTLQPVTVRVKREADPSDATVAAGIRRARGCERSPEPAPSGGPRSGPAAWGVRAAGPADEPEVIVVTDEEGRFCFRAPLPADRYTARCSYAPRGATPLVDGVDREISFDLTKRGLTLHFDPTPKILQLDSPRATIEAVAIVDDQDGPRVAPRLPLVLANEKGEVGRAETDASGRARFILPGTSLGPPGPGELHVSFAGDDETARAAHTEETERHVKVTLKVPGSDLDEPSIGVPEDGIPLHVEVGSSLGPVPEGSVEARIADVVVGAAPVERGVARLTLTFSAQGNEAVARLRYVPASPWYEPLGEPTVRLPIRAASVFAKAPLLLAGFAVVAFFLMGRLSAQKNRPEPLPATVDGGRGGEASPEVKLVRPSDRGQRGWSGRVVDAHDGSPVRGARVWIERGTFEGRSVLASAETSGDGRFALPDVGAIAQSERISAEARLYARHTQDLPAPGELSIALTQRRRALLAKLVQWARRRGAPFDARPEPTPGHVRRVAGGDVGTAHWADAVERAVFGPDEVDARAEQEVNRLAPNGGSRSEPQTGAGADHHSHADLEK